MGLEKKVNEPGGSETRESQKNSSMQLALAAPEEFSFVPSEWEKWIRRFERYRMGNRLQESSEKTQVNILIYCMGEKAEEIYTSFTPEPETYDACVKKFEEYFIPKRNIIYERTKFLKRKQGEESGEEFITALHALAKHCEWGNLLDDMILLTLVIGMKDEGLSDRLQLDSSLTLEKAVNSLRQVEELYRQKKDLHSTSASSVCKVERFVDQKGRFDKQKKKWDKTKQRNQTRSDRCIRCGFERHDYDKCPAKSIICKKCKKSGHYSRVCRTKGVCEVRENGYREQNDEYFVGAVTDKWSVEL